jgi:hypothetical protein
VQLSGGVSKPKYAKCWCFVNPSSPILI